MILAFTNGASFIPSIFDALSQCAPAHSTQISKLFDDMNYGTTVVSLLSKDLPSRRSHGREQFPLRTCKHHNESALESTLRGFIDEGRTREENVGIGWNSTRGLVVFNSCGYSEHH